jgi:hypothetical protein
VHCPNLDNQIHNPASKICIFGFELLKQFAITGIFIFNFVGLRCGLEIPHGHTLLVEVRAAPFAF